MPIPERRSNPAFPVQYLRPYLSVVRLELIWFCPHLGQNDISFRKILPQAHHSDTVRPIYLYTRNLIEVTAMLAFHANSGSLYFPSHQSLPIEYW